jgi:tetratricopeptide (TPR) repeat protein
MNNDVLARLAAAQSDEERAWLLTEALLDTLSPDLAALAWAAAVPHWFNAEILAVLRPELKDQSEQLYTDLQALVFVRPYTGPGHYIHESTRRLMLDRLWHDREDEYRLLAQRATEYFAGRESPSDQMEYIYHLLIADPQDGPDAFWNLDTEWHNTFRFAELESLADMLLEHVRTERVPQRARAMIQWRQGKAASRTYRIDEALTASYAAQKAARGDANLEANVLQALGDGQNFRKERDAALASYEQALQLFRAVGDRLGEANVLQALGDGQNFRKERDAALASYEQALQLFRAVGDRLGEANVFLSLGRMVLNTNDEEHGIEYLEQAADLYEAVDSQSGSANVRIMLAQLAASKGNLQQAIDYTQPAADFGRSIRHPIGDRLQAQIDEWRLQLKA